MAGRGKQPDTEAGGRLKMRFRVTFKERTNAGGQPSESPSEALEAQAPEGVILDKSFLSRDEPAGLHNEETIEEDDGFLSIVPETWEYAIADGRESEFLDAVKVSGVALACVPLDESSDMD
jgi:hypothetical protein